MTDITIRINGVKIRFDEGQSPMQSGDVIRVPLRSTFYALGFDVTWDGESRRITVENPRFKFIFHIGSDLYTIHDKANDRDIHPQPLGVPPSINENGVTIMPIKSPVEAIGGNLEWDRHTNTVLISTNNIGSIKMIVDVDNLEWRGGNEAPDLTEGGLIGHLAVGTILNTINPVQTYNDSSRTWIKVLHDASGITGWVEIRNNRTNTENIIIHPTPIWEINEDLTKAIFSTYGSVDFTFDVTHRDNNAYIRGAIRSVNEAGTAIEWVPLEDFVRIGDFKLDRVTWDNANKKIFHYGKSQFILKEFMATRNPAYRAGTELKPQGIMVHSIAAANPTLRRHVGPSRDNPDKERMEHRGTLGTNINDNCWNRTSERLSVHAWIGTTRVGTISTYQVLPWDIRGVHAGGSANRTHIGFEICVLWRNDTALPLSERAEITELDRAFFNATYKEAVQLCAYLCEIYNFNPLDDVQIIDHYGGSYVEPDPVSSRSHDVTHETNGIFSIFGKTLGESVKIRRLDTFRRDVAKIMEEMR
jgi:hypothetical protein